MSTSQPDASTDSLPIAFDASRVTDARRRLFERAERLGLSFKKPEANPVQSSPPRRDTENKTDSNNPDDTDEDDEETPLLDKEDDGQVLGFAARRRFGLHKQLKKQHDIYDVPLLVEAPVQEYPRNPADEGLYVAPMPKVSAWNYRRMISRLLREDAARKDKHFFDEDMIVHMEPSPVSLTPLRPATRGDSHEVSSKLKTKMVVPTQHTGKDQYFEFQVSLKHVVFTDHSLFTEEDRLCSQIREMYSEYKRRQVVNLVQYYGDKLRGLRVDAGNIRKEIRVLLGGDMQSKPQRDRLRAQLKKLVQVLEGIEEAIVLKDEEEADVQRNFKEVYKTWVQIREWRDEMTKQLVEAGKFTTTGKHGKKQYIGNPLRLRVRRNHPNAEAEKRQWINDADQELREREELFWLRKVADLDDPGVKSAVEKYIKSITEGKQKPAGRQAAAGDDEQAPLVDEENPDDAVARLDDGHINAAGLGDAGSIAVDIGHALHGRRVTKVMFEDSKFELETVRSRVEQRMNSFRRPPGSPVYWPILEETRLELSDVLDYQAERRRRRDIEKFRVRASLYVNDKPVMTSRPTTLSFPSFTATFLDTATLQLHSVPKSITLKLEHVELLGGTEIGRLYVPVPEFASAPLVQTYEFSANSGFADGRRYSGYVELGLAWNLQGSERTQTIKGEDLTEQQRLNIMRYDRLALSKHRHLLHAAEKQRSAIDPNDPRNVVILELIRRANLARLHGKAFKALQFAPEMQLLREDIYLESARRRVLRERQRSHLIREQIPLEDSDIPSHLYELIHVEDHLDAEDGEAADATQGRASGGEVIDDQDNQRFFAQWIAKSKMSSISKDVVDVGEVVREDTPVDFATPFAALFQWLNTLFLPRRKLRVQREKLMPISSPESCNIVLQVIRGQNLPVKKLAHATKRGQHELDPKHTNLFVEVSFQESPPVRTASVQGSNPHWNELLTIPFHPPGNSFSPSTLMSLSDRVYFNVFDQVDEIQSTDHRLQNTRTHRRERRFIGAFSLPFTTIYTNGAVQGHIQVEVPVTNLAYEQPYPNGPAIIFIYATLDPPLTIPPSSTDMVQWRHRGPFFEYCYQWEQKLRKLEQCKKREIITFAGDINGKPKLVTRFITPQKPPNGITVAKAPRFVSLIPFAEDWQASGGAEDVWCTSNEFLTLGQGDWEEHAILLCNYFKWFEVKSKEKFWKSYVVLGHGIPEGSTAYVLRVREADGITDQVFLYNAVTGDEYDMGVDGHICPLTSVGCIFNEEQIWANVQVEERPSKLSYNLKNKTAWRPLFTSAYPSEDYAGRCLQAPIKYFPSSEEYFQKRAKAIARVVEYRFEKWRRLPTRWNYAACKILRDHLFDFEKVKQGLLSSVEDDSSVRKLKQVYNGMYGFPLNFSECNNPYFVEDSESNPIVKAVKNTHLHNVEDSSVEFALACYIYPDYPNGIASIWVYLASLTVSRDY